MSFYTEMTKEPFLYEHMEDEIEKHTEWCCADSLDHLEQTLFEEIYQWYYGEAGANYLEHFDLLCSDQRDLVQDIVTDIALSIWDYNKITSRG